MLQAQSNYAPKWDSTYIPEQVRSVRRIKKTTKKFNQQRKSLIKGGIILFFYALLLVFLCIKGATLGYQINSLEREINQLETSNRSIELKIAQKSSLEKVEQVAVNDLGMYKPDMSKALEIKVNAQPVQVATTPSNSSSEKVSNNLLHSIYTNISRLAQNTN